MKGDLERDIDSLGFRSLTLVRPGLIGGAREDRRPGEQVASRILGTLRPILPRNLRINPAEIIAGAMLGSALAAAPGRHVIAAAALTAVATP